MQFTTHTTDLVEALGWVAKSLPTRPASPILAGIKITVEADTLTLAAFDYEQSAVATLDIQQVSGGCVVVSGRLLADIVRALPKGEVTFTLDGTKLQVRANTAKFSLQTMPVEDYPTLPPRPAMSGSVEAAVFADAVRSVVSAAGKDDMLPVLTSINVTIDPNAGTMTLASTDRFRLAVRTVPVKGSGDDVVTALVPARVLDTWAKALPVTDGDEFTFGIGADDAAIFAMWTSTRSGTVRLIDGQYPRWQSLIPKDFNAETVVNAADLAAAVRRVSLVATKTTPAVLTFTSDGVSVTAASDDEASDTVAATHHGTEITIGFNVAYLTDGLAALGDTPARFALVAGNKPAVIRPVNDEDAYTYLLMPMRGGV